MFPLIFKEGGREGGIEEKREKEPWMWGETWISSSCTCPSGFQT